MTDKRKQSRRRGGRKRMDRRVGDRRADGLPPAPDTPARQDTGKRQRSADRKTTPSSVAKTSARKSPGKPRRP